ncbi:RsiV family protein [Paenibacillus andongensis]|uniref:RsiV family protein n=1 Tax=Paenibacillus andongensis TaxID=2975482 RepID=UPI0021BA6484|nr:RsiV family protein [Paenibacillus andongensis]
MNEKIEQMKQHYMDIPIPKELDFIVNQAIKQNKKRKSNVIWGIAAAAAAIIFVTGINTSPALAHALSEVPIVGDLVKVLTFREYKFNDGTYKANVEVPSITNLDNKTLEDTLNTKYLEEGKKLYTDFTIEMEQLKQNGGGHLGVDSGYVIKTDNDQILSVGRYVVNTVGSSSTTFKYDTIDKKKQLLITLPSLFKDDAYIRVISENIKEQMKEQMKLDPKKIYWVEGVSNEVNSYFKAITKDQNFYINANGQLVLSFQKYEVAPGYMGVVEFIIPTLVLSDVLSMRGEYIH